jgi:hypothetical protein
MLLTKLTAKSRRFRIWGLCLLIVVVSACIVFVTYVARQPSEPFILANIVRTNVSGTQAISIELSNRMFFKVNCWFQPELLRSGKWVLASAVENKPGFCVITAHSQKTSVLLEDSEGAR